MRPKAHCAWLFLLIAAVPGQATAQNPPMKPVTLASAQEKYLLGEEVVLAVYYTNVSDKVIRAMAEHDPSDIRISISRDGRVFVPLVFSAFAERMARGVSLKPGEYTKHILRVFFNRAVWPATLAFPASGTYFIRATYPGYSAQSIEPIESNTVEVQIEEPKGRDAKLLERLKQLEGGLAGLQWERGPSKPVMFEVKKLLEEWPETRYATFLRSVLSRYYFHQRAELTLDEQANLRKLTGITYLGEAKDNRLDQQIVFQFDGERMRRNPDGTVGLSLELLLELLQNQGGFKLDAPQYLRRREIGITGNPLLLREYMAMEFVTDYRNAYWIKKDNGYYLTRWEDANYTWQDGTKK